MSTLIALLPFEWEWGQDLNDIEWQHFSGQKLVDYWFWTTRRQIWTPFLSVALYSSNR